MQRPPARRLLLLTISCAAAIAARRISAQPVPLGGELLVNAYTSGAQNFPAVAGQGTGFVVVWNGAGSGDAEGIFGRRFDANGAPGAEFRVNATTSGPQMSPSVASRTTGEFVVVWDGVDGNYFGVLGQRFDAAGAPAGPEFLVNSSTTENQFGSQVAMNRADGSFVVVFRGDVEDGDSTGVFARRYTASGASLGPSFRVNTYTTGAQTRPAVSMSTLGTFLVVWEGPGPTDAGGIWAQRYAADGVPQGSQFRVNTVTTGLQVIPRVSVDAVGENLVLWSSGAAGGNEVAGQRLDAGGGALGPQFVVNAATTSITDTSVVASNGPSSFLVAWRAAESGGANTILGRRVVASAPLGAAFRVNTYTTGFRLAPAVAALDARHFVVVWAREGSGDGYGIFGRRFCIPKGDANLDGETTILDVFYLINMLFAGGPGALDSGDANGDGVTNVLDVFYLINHLFAGGPAPVC